MTQAGGRDFAVHAAVETDLELMHATDLLNNPARLSGSPVIVVHGDEPQLKTAVRDATRRCVLGEDPEDEVSLTRFDPDGLEWRTVRDELMTLSMFSHRRLVVVDGADEFISEHRPSLEAYVESPSSRSVLLLDVKTWRKNTRLAKRLADGGLVVECTELTGARLQNWIVDQCRNVHGKQIARNAAVLIPELAGTGLTSLTQEIAKLAAYLGDRPKIEVDDVRALVGGWRAETTWKMTDAVRDGQPAEALAALAKLLAAGEAPQRLLGGINYVFRKYAKATELSRQGGSLHNALRSAGVFPRDIDSSERYLRRIGRARAEHILAFLLAADAALKGGSRLGNRLQLEQLLLRLSGHVPAAS
ncbi:MAG: DNA polymerase III subunit delta [Planctomycetota bacterium]|nr:MAG: DNA polymerase III subunit delta [Planctomycetota bacterium]